MDNGRPILVWFTVTAIAIVSPNAVAQEAPRAVLVREVQRIPQNAHVVTTFARASGSSDSGSVYGTWDRDPGDATQSCRAERLASGGVNGTTDPCLKIRYDVDSPQSACNGFWLKLGSGSISGMKTLSLCLRGDAGRGFPKRLKLEIKTAGGHVGVTTLGGIGATWRKLTVPLRQAGIAGNEMVTELVLVFEDHASQPKEGVLYLDNVLFY